MHSLNYHTTQMSAFVLSPVMLLILYDVFRDAPNVKHNENRIFQRSIKFKQDLDIMVKKTTHTQFYFSILMQ